MVLASEDSLSNLDEINHSIRLPHFSQRFRVIHTTYITDYVYAHVQFYVHDWQL
jgi:hypothetical protein